MARDVELERAGTVIKVERRMRRPDSEDPLSTRRVRKTELN